MITLTDKNLMEIISALAPRERKIIEEHLRGRETVESCAILRAIKFRLKRKARSRPKAQAKWLV